MNQNAFIFLLLTLLKFSYSKLSDQCTKSNTFWYSLKYPYIDILKLPNTQSSALTCPITSSENCCSPEMSKDMVSVSEIKLKGFAEEKLEKILMMFSNDSYDLMNIYLNDLESTKNDLNQLFSTTYGYNYKVHKDFFFKWFDKLKLYMQGRLHNIEELLDNFFLEMAQRIVRILIAPDSTPDITACRTSRLIESKPYQDTDVILKKKIIRSYPPARLLVNGIAVGRDVFKELMKNTQPSSKCVEQFNSAFHCMMCRGLTVKSCSKTCTVLIDNCFGSFKSSDMKKLDRAFTNYIKILNSLAIKLDNPFNFPEVNNKMNVQISTAIMNVQTMYPNVKEQINAKCQGGAGGTSGGGGGGGGGLPISRKRRQASQEFYKWQNANNNNNQPKQWWENTLAKNVNEEKKEFNNYQSKPNDVLSPFARKIKLKYKDLESFFKNRRTEFCSSVSTADATVDCWNGSAVVKNSLPITGKEAKKKNEKIEDPTIKSAINQLNEISKRITSYLQGKNPDPMTVPVQDYTLYVSKKVNKGNGNIEDRSESQPGGAKIDGSGDLEGNKFPQRNLEPEKPKKEPPVQPKTPDKTNWESPTFPEGSGDTDNKLPDENTKKKTPSLPIKPEPVTIQSSILSTVSTTKRSVMTSTRSSTVAPNQIPDDEDLNPGPQVPDNQPRVNLPERKSSTAATIIQPEGSGNQPAPPDMGENKPPPVQQSITSTTTQSSETVLEGSGEEPKGRVPPVEKQGPFLPMLPDSSKTSVTNAPVMKPDPNPDEEKAPPIEGSGKTVTDLPIVPQIEPQPVTQPAPVIIHESTKPPTESPYVPDQYPGKVPPEVWLPGIKGAGSDESDNQKTTPSGWASSFYSSDLKVVVYRTMLILSLYRLL